MTIAPLEAAAPPAFSPLLARDGRPASVVHLVAELAPYARTGGLGEAVSSLAAYQAASGLPASIIIPLYRQARARLPKLVPVGEPYTVHVGGRAEYARLFTTPDDGPPEGTTDRRRRRRAQHYFIDNEYYFDRAGIYGEGNDYGDNGRRFAFLAAAALAALPRIAAGPLILHAHDWHAAMAPIYLRTWYADDPWYQQVSSVLSIHNAGFQGHFAPDALPDLGIPWSLYDWRALEWYGKANILKGGMALADAVTTVSPNHANELRTPAGGFGLHDHFRGLGDRFGGIVNGIDQQIWNPQDDAHLAAPYSAESLAGKQACRRVLQQVYNLPERDDVPIFAMAARLVWQKGLDLILADTGLFDLPAQFIFLGAGEARYERALREWAGRRPDRVRVDTHFNDPAEHRLMGGADVCLMPCQYEPCGLTQMRAQRYGTLPLVRAVGGLADTVDDGETGFVFDAYDARAFVATIVRAIRTFHHRPTWIAMVREAMRRDFGWERSEERYLEVYRAVMQQV
ncbi:MAG: glycogen synthase [Gemmatirosa sp.]|nr:glycogen synthase [Gemmatirosa sp.]